MKQISGVANGIVNWYNRINSKKKLSPNPTFDMVQGSKAKTGIKNPSWCIPKEVEVLKKIYSNKNIQDLFINLVKSSPNSLEVSHLAGYATTLLQMDRQLIGQLFGRCYQNTTSGAPETWMSLLVEFWGAQNSKGEKNHEWKNLKDDLHQFF